MPVGFIGHGNPLSVASENRTAPWSAWSRQLPRPSSILVVSAHWEDTPVTIGATTDHQKLLYDFGGFPEFMYNLQYPAPGAPGLADRVEELLAGNVQIRRSDRPLDHGAWIPLMKMWPDAGIPVLQISMPIDLDEGHLYDLGRELAPLRDEGVFILGTGNLVHDIRGASFYSDPIPPEYAAGFDTWVARSLAARDDRSLIGWREQAPDALRSHPSAEHYRPILVAAGAAPGESPRFPVEGFEHGTISRRSVEFDS
jgi:4,5-DOPA dioxygenase extradiol